MAEPFVSNKIVFFTDHHKLVQLAFVFQSFAASSKHGTQIEQIGCAPTGFQKLKKPPSACEVNTILTPN
jgi:hypothetical protein